MKWRLFARVRLPLSDHQYGALSNAITDGYYPNRIQPPIRLPVATLTVVATRLGLQLPMESVGKNSECSWIYAGSSVDRSVPESGRFCARQGNTCSVYIGQWFQWKRHRFLTPREAPGWWHPWHARLVAPVACATSSYSPQLPGGGLAGWGLCRACTRWRGRGRSPRSGTWWATRSASVPRGRSAEECDVITTSRDEEKYQTWDIISITIQLTPSK